MERDMSIEGTCEPTFQLVADTLAENLRTRGEVGAAVSVYLDGVKKVDLWGGHSDRAKSRPWREDTIVNVMSVTKGMAALCVHALIEEGVLKLDARVADYLSLIHI